MKKRNILLYIKQKSSITAFIFMFIFIVTLIVSFLPSLSYKKGINDEFKNYDITYMSTNNYSVTYAASDNILFYSQNKKQTSTLNNFANIKDLSNEYVDPTSHLYNFIKIDYEFDSKIVDVKGISDDMYGQNGETFVLTNSGNLYLISQRSNKVEVLLKNVKKINVKYDDLSNKRIYLILDENDTLSLCYFNNNILEKHDIINDEINEFFYLGNNKIVLHKNNNLYMLQTNIIDNQTLTYNKLASYGYDIYSCNEALLNDITDLNISTNKIVEVNDKYYYLYDNIIHSFIFDGSTLSNNDTIKTNNNVLNIYSTGEDALIVVCDDGLYYLGTLRKHDVFYDKITYLNVSEGLIYGNRNSIILLHKEKLYLYDEGSFVGMYKNIFTTMILRYFSIFVIIMIVFYIILSFIEDNKRFNRYFDHQRG